MEYSTPFSLFTLSDLFPQWKHHGRRYRQLVQPHVKEFLSKLKVRAQLTADTDPGTFRMCILCSHLDHCKNRRVMRVIERIQLCILAVDRQRVLCQIVCSNTEEINFFRKITADHDRR